MAKSKFVVEVEYDPAITDPESLASALDTLVETATSTPGILGDCGDPAIGEFIPVEERRRAGRRGRP